VLPPRDWHYRVKVPAINSLQELRMRFLALFFIIVPLAEMLLLFEVSDHIGGLTTLALVVATAIIGLQILRLQGLSTLLRANQRLQSGELPAQEIIEGMLLAGAGALLLTPGFITDTLGFILLTGPLRRQIASRLLRSGFMAATGGGGTTGSFRMWSSMDQGRSGTVVDGEFTEEGDLLPPIDPDSDSGSGKNS